MHCGIVTTPPLGQIHQCPDPGAFKFNMAANTEFQDLAANSNENQPRPEKRQKLDENIPGQCKERLSDSKESEKSLDIQNTVENPRKSGVNKGTRTHRLECDVGITQYCSTHEGFSGILKQRYSDFLVNEINLDGKTVHLTSTELPEVFVQEEIENSVLPSEMLQKLQDFVNSEDTTSKLVVATEDDKEQRTLIHREIRQKFPFLGNLTVITQIMHLRFKKNNSK
jgi:tRNA pseudouridine13 synthase